MICGRVMLGKLPQFVSHSARYRDNESTVADYVEFKNGCFYWNPLFIGAVHEWEVESMAQLLEDLYEIKIWYGEEDKLA